MNSEHVSMPKVENYPSSQISMSTEVNTTEQLKLQDGMHTHIIFNHVFVFIF